MSTYIKRPEKVRAVLFVGDNPGEVTDLRMIPGEYALRYRPDGSVSSMTAEWLPQPAYTGQWVVRLDADTYEVMYHNDFCERYEESP